MLVEKGAGDGTGIPDSEYDRVGATIVTSADEVWKRAEMIVKVKEPLAPEYDAHPDGPDHLHVLPPRRRARARARCCVKKKVAAVAYETIQLDDGSLPLLRPMSEVAGKMSIQVGAACLEKEHGGKGILLGGVPGVRRGRVAIIGGGVVGTNAAKIAVGMGAEVTILDVNLEPARLPRRRLPGPRRRPSTPTPRTSRRAVREADLVIGAVLIPGGKAPKLVTRGADRAR